MVVFTFNEKNKAIELHPDNMAKPKTQSSTILIFWWKLNIHRYPKTTVAILWLDIKVFKQNAKCFFLINFHLSYTLKWAWVEKAVLLLCIVNISKWKIFDLNVLESALNCGFSHGSLSQNACLWKCGFSFPILLSHWNWYRIRSEIE